MFKVNKVISILTLISFLFIGCSFLGLNTPQTPKQELAYSWSTLKGIYATTNDYYDKGLIKKDFAKEALNRGTEIEALLDLVGIALVNGDTVTTTNLMIKINQLLIKLNNELLERSIKND
jgi:hypothetical protein